MTHIRTAPTESNLKQADDAGMLVQAAYRIGVSASHRTAHQGQAITPARRILISGSLLRNHLSRRVGMALAERDHVSSFAGTYVSAALTSTGSSWPFSSRMKSTSWPEPRRQ